MKEKITAFTETRHGDKPRPSQSISTLMVSTRWMVERVNSRVLGDAKNGFAFGVNAPLGVNVRECYLDLMGTLHGSSSSVYEQVWSHVVVKALWVGGRLEKHSRSIYNLILKNSFKTKLYSNNLTGTVCSCVCFEKDSLCLSLLCR